MAVITIGKENKLATCFTDVKIILQVVTGLHYDHIEKLFLETWQIRGDTLLPFPQFSRRNERLFEHETRFLCEGAREE